MTTPTFKTINRYSFDATLQARTLRNEADKFERDLVILKLKEAVRSTEETDWDSHEIDLKPGSSLYQLHMPASILLNKLSAEPLIQQHAVRLFREPLIDAFVNAEGSLFIRGDAWEPITQMANRSASTQAQLKCLTDIAKQIGGIVSSSNTVEISQWMKFHDLNVPTTPAQTKNLLDFLEFDIPSADYLGNYWNQLFATEDGETVLTTDQQAAMRKLTAEFLPKGKNLLDKLYEEALNSRPVIWDDAGDMLKSLVSHPTSRALAKRYITRLAWFGANADESVHDEDLDQLLITAILLDLNPPVVTQDARSPFGSLDIYSPDNVDLPHFLVRQQLETYLVNNQRVGAQAAPLAAHLLLANVAPEFLIKQLPSSPLLGSIAWVTFSRTVALIELQVRGASRLMTFAQVMQYAAIEPVGPYQEKISGLAAINPIVDWALLNSVITRAALQRHSAGALQEASTAYHAFLEQLNQAATTFATPPPSRRALALAQLQAILPDSDDLEKEFLTHAGTAWQYQPVVPYAADEMFENQKMSMVELHMSGDLVRQQWNDPAYDLFKKYPALLPELNKLSGDFEAPVRAYQQQLQHALATNLQLALAQLDEADQKDLLRSEITLYTVRASAQFDAKAPVALNGRFGMEYLTSIETQEAIDAATGHYGVVMCASFRGKTTCFELFSLHGQCLKNPALGAAISQAALHKNRARIDFTGDLNRAMKPAQLSAMPLDITNYTHGSVPNRKVSSEVVLDKLAVLAAPIETTIDKKGVYQRFHYPNLERIAHFIARHRPLATYAELKEIALGQTRLEKLIRKNEERTEFMLNLIIPFRSCIAEIRSGERVRVAQGIFGCIMDAIAVIGGVAGAASNIAGIMSKTVSSCSRIASIAKELVILAIGTFNPLDGLRSYASIGAKALLKGGLRLNLVGMDAVTKARMQVHRLTKMADSYDLVKASKRSDLVQGTWIPKDSSESVNAWACRSRNNQWHALNRFGRPWGESLKNFRRVGEIRLPRFDKQLPALYTSTVIENALSSARRKMDAAVRVLAQANRKVDVDALARLLLGGSSIEAVNNVLMAQKSYCGAVDLGNFLLDEADSANEMLTLDLSEFQVWKNAGPLQREKQFLRVDCADLNERFREHHLNEGVIADDLIRTLLHASSIDDLSYALPLPNTDSRYQQLDVAPLLNLANGHHPIADDGVATRYHDRAQARNNADSLTVFTSLLSQLETHPANFAENLSAMSAALQAARQGAINRPVPIYLNRL